MPILSHHQIRFFQAQGYLSLPNYASSADIARLQEAAQQMATTLPTDAAHTFASHREAAPSQAYFLQSAYNICLFFEPTIPAHILPQQAINKIGHALHDLHPVFQQFSYRAPLLHIAQQLGLYRPAIVQSQYIYKPPGFVSPVKLHTDTSFLYTKPPSCLGAWLALEDAAVQNGCLGVIPGSHNAYPIQERFIQHNGGTKFVDTPHKRTTWPTEVQQPLPAEKGTLILLHGSLVHGSYSNQSGRTRQAYVLHLADLNAHWAADNWLQRPARYPFVDMQQAIEA